MNIKLKLFLNFLTWGLMFLGIMYTFMMPNNEAIVQEPLLDKTCINNCFNNWLNSHQLNFWQQLRLSLANEGVYSVDILNVDFGNVYYNYTTNFNYLAYFTLTCCTLCFIFFTKYILDTYYSHRQRQNIISNNPDSSSSSDYLLQQQLYDGAYEV